MADKPACVDPLKDCPHLKEVTGQLPDNGINVKQKCSLCDNVGENWTCLSCYHVGCGRFIKQHGVEHWQQKKHAVALSLADLSCWCYACDAYVISDRLKSIVQAAEKSKFG